LEGAAEEVYIHGAELAGEMIQEIISNDSVPSSHEGTPTIFKWRKPNESEVSHCETLKEWKTDWGKRRGRVLGLKAYRLACFSFLSGFSMNCFIGTAVALAGLREGLRWAEVDVPICRQNDSSRFGSGLRANLKILKGAWATILVDLRKS